MFSHAKIIAGPIFQKLKEKKTNILDETYKALKNLLFHCINLEDLKEDIQSAMNDKNPDFKKNLLIFFEKIYEN